MATYSIQRAGTDIVITVSEPGFNQSVRFPEQLFHDIVEEIQLLPEAHGYPVGLSVGTDRVEVPYDELLRLADRLKLN